MVNLLSGTWAVLLALAATSPSVTIPGAPRSEFRKTYALHPDGRVTIRNLYGDVRITTWDRDEVQVEAIKTAADRRRLNEALIVVDSASPELLSIQTQYDGADTDRPASVEYRITVPRTANLQEINLVNGGLSISGLAGPVKASAVNGSIRAEKLEGEADLSTVNGKLDVDFDRISRFHPISLSSVNGPIHLSVPASAGITLNANNLSGGIDSDVGRVWRASGGHRLHAEVKGGGTSIRLHNINGGISVHSRPCMPARVVRQTGRLSGALLKNGLPTGFCLRHAVC